MIPRSGSRRPGDFTGMIKRGLVGNNGKEFSDVGVASVGGGWYRGGDDDHGGQKTSKHIGTFFAVVLDLFSLTTSSEAFDTLLILRQSLLVPFLLHFLQLCYLHSARPAMNQHATSQRDCALSIFDVLARSAWI